MAEDQSKLNKNIPSKKISPENIKNSQNNSFQIFKDKLIKKSEGKNLKNLRNDISSLLASFSNNQKELLIQSDIQSEESNILNAEGNVLVSLQGNILKSDSLVYDKKNKIIIAKGNVSLNVGEQIFKMVSLKYDFVNKKGYLICLLYTSDAADE